MLIPAVVPGRTMQAEGAALACLTDSMGMRCPGTPCESAHSGRCRDFSGYVRKRTEWGMAKA